MSKPLLIVMGILMSFFSYSQNVGINTTGATPNSSAGLDVDYTNKGVLIPRVALTASNSNAPIGASIATSLIVYNTATAGASPNHVVPGYYYWNGSMWIRLTDNNFLTYSESTSLFGCVTTRATITVTTLATDKVMLRGEFDFNKQTGSYVAVGVYRGATEIHEIAVLGSNNADNSAHVQWVDTPGAGTWTYTLQTKVGAGGFNTIYGASLHAVVVKQ